jgi:hypothetical protein
LEDEFFFRVDEKLRADIRESLERERSREALSLATGLSDPELLDALLDCGLDVSTLAAFALVPAVFVAWADYSVTEPEKEAVMKAAEQRGIAADSLAGQLLTSWLNNPPKKSLWDTWHRYAVSVKDSLSPTATEMLSKNILEIARTVAETSGGILGFGKTSDNEQTVLDEIKAALD